MSKKMWIGGTLGALLVIGMIGSSLDGDEPEVSAAAPISAEVGAEIGTSEVAATEPATPTPAPEPAPTTESEPAPAVETVTEQVTETVTAEPVEEPMEEVIENRVSNAEREVEDEDLGISDSEIAHLALQITWDGMTISEQSDICFGWGLDQDMMVDAFLEGSEDMMTRSEVRDFFNGVC